MRAWSVAALLTAPLGCAVFQAGALAEFREAVTLKSGYAQAWSNLGFAFF
jgi:hypothetical protein